MTHPSIRVVLADDHPALRAGIRHILNADPGITVVGEAATGADALRLCLDLRPDVVVLDINMPDLSGIEVARGLVGSGVRVLAFSAHEGRGFVSGVLAAGASGYLTKDRDEGALLEAIHAVAGGEARWLVHPNPPGTSADALTDREHDVLVLLARGLSNRSIAETLFVSESTVRNTLTSVYLKLNVQSSREASAWAWANGLAERPDGR